MILQSTITATMHEVILACRPGFPLSGEDRFIANAFLQPRIIQPQRVRDGIQTVLPRQLNRSLRLALSCSIGSGMGLLLRFLISRPRRQIMNLTGQAN